MAGGATAASNTLREKRLEEISKVKWMPEWGEDRIHSMIAERPDWCVSRQRFWGVPLIVFLLRGMRQAIGRLQGAARTVVKWFAKEGADAWFTHTVEELLPAGTKCACGHTKWRKEHDILDVWFDSGSSHLAVLQLRTGIGLLTCTWKGRTNTADGFTVRCWSRLESRCRRTGTC